MAEKPKSVLLPVMAAAVFAGLGRMVIQKIKADRAARQNGARGTAAQSGVGRVGSRRGGRIRGGAGKDRMAGPVDEKTRQWISEVVRTPRQ
ncbi:MAG TPA: hypothetical protein VJS86_07845 [Arthrobacter sp.]|nr:hypothetical protein [Arthrobacter sp.]